MLAESTTSRVIRVLLVDDHAFVRAGLAGLLASVPGIEVVGECGDGSQAASLAERTDPDVVLMDLRMPKMSGTEATRHLLLQNPDLRILILTGSIGRENVAEVAAAGASGFVVKGGDPRQLVEAVRTVAAGGTVWPDDNPARRRR